MNSGYSARIDMTGQKIGKWTVLEYAYNDKGKQAHWKCKCDCGNVSIVAGRPLRAGLSTSCGCYKSEFTKEQRTIQHEFVDGKECKRCRTCKEWKELSRFSKASDRWDGLDKDCKLCLSVIRKARQVSRRSYMREWTNHRYATYINHKIKTSVRARVRSALKNNYKAAKTSELLGCSIEYLKQHLESQFQDGMSWENYGKWHIDHKRPCASFDLSDSEQQRICFHFTNLQPLWMMDNIRKGARWESE